MNKLPPEVLVVTRSDIRRLMKPADYLAAVELGFRAGAMGKADVPHPMHLPMARGSFHAKGASISLGRDYVAVKVNANFPGNPDRLGLPMIQGAILLADGGNGALLAILDSIEVTIQRTAAASAVAARLLARPDSATMLVCGCGEQGRAHVAALREVLPVERTMLWDRDPRRATELAAALEAEAIADLESAALSADLIATCTPSTEPFLRADMIRPGTFIAAVGTDSPGKSEIAPDLMARSTVVTDLTAQCAEMGDLHHAMKAGALSRADVHAELGQLLVGEIGGRSGDNEIVIFDSTGTGLQDVAAAAIIYERCSRDPSVSTVALSAV